MTTSVFHRGSCRQKLLLNSKGILINFNVEDVECEYKGITGFIASVNCDRTYVSTNIRMKIHYHEAQLSYFDAWADLQLHISSEYDNIGTEVRKCKVSKEKKIPMYASELTSNDLLSLLFPVGTVFTY